MADQEEPIHNVDRQCILLCVVEAFGAVGSGDQSQASMNAKVRYQRLIHDLKTAFFSRAAGPPPLED